MTVTMAATYLDETAGVLAAAYGVTVDEALNAKLAALYEGDSTVQSEAAWREVRRMLWERLEPAEWPMPRNTSVEGLTQDEVVEIREAYASGEYSQPQLAALFGCDATTICGVVTGDSFPNAGGPITRRGPGNGVHKFTQSAVIAMRERYAAGQETQEEIAAAFDTTAYTVCRIVTGNSYAFFGGPITRRGQGKRPPKRESA